MMTGRLIARGLCASAFLLLWACDQDTPTASSPSADDRIDCRIGAATSFERFCTLELSRQNGRRVLTIRKPDGGFRRLLVTGDGRGVVAADGAEPARVKIVEQGRIDVAIGGDNFRLPATVRP